MNLEFEGYVAVRRYLKGLIAMLPFLLVLVESRFIHVQSTWRGRDRH